MERKKRKGTNLVQFIDWASVGSVMISGDKGGNKRRRRAWLVGKADKLLVLWLVTKKQRRVIGFLSLSSDWFFQCVVWWCELIWGARGPGRPWPPPAAWASLLVRSWAGLWWARSGKWGAAARPAAGTAATPAQGRGSRWNGPWRIQSDTLHPVKRKKKKRREKKEKEETTIDIQKAEKKKAEKWRKRKKRRQEGRRFADRLQSLILLSGPGAMRSRPRLRGQGSPWVWRGKDWRPVRRQSREWRDPRWATLFKKQSKKWSSHKKNNKTEETINNHTFNSNTDHCSQIIMILGHVEGAFFTQEHVAGLGRPLGS